MITTHVLDTARGKPASGVPVRLEFATAEPAGTGASWQLLGSGVTDGDGRLRTLTPAGPVAPGRYRIAFEVAGYFAAHDVESFFPLVEIQFTVRDGEAHYHVPLLLSPFGYSTYRGS